MSNSLQRSLVKPLEFFFQAEDGIRDDLVTGVQTCALPIWAAFFEQVGIFHLRVGHHRADDDVISVFDDRVKPGNAANIDDVARLGEAHLHQREQALAAAENLDIVSVCGKKIHSLVDRARRAIFERRGNHYSEILRPLDSASCIRRHTVSGVSGKSRTFIANGLSASSTALAMAAGDGMAAPSPAAFWPSGVKGEGDGRCMTSIFGVSAVEHFP